MRAATQNKVVGSNDQFTTSRTRFEFGALVEFSDATSPIDTILELLMDDDVIFATFGWHLCEIHFDVCC
jgi:hypothetical protein